MNKIDYIIQYEHGPDWIIWQNLSFTDFFEAKDKLKELRGEQRYANVQFRMAFREVAPYNF